MLNYKIENKLNGKIYIGQTRRTLEERMNEHKKECCKNCSRYRRQKSSGKNLSGLSIFAGVEKNYFQRCGGFYFRRRDRNGRRKIFTGEFAGRICKKYRRVESRLAIDFRAHFTFGFVHRQRHRHGSHCRRREIAGHHRDLRSEIRRGRLRRGNQKFPQIFSATNSGDCSSSGKIS